MRKYVCLSIVYAWMAMTASAQQVSGRVYDASNDSPLTGALVTTVSDTAVTDAEGRFVLAATKLPAQVQVRFLGYHLYEASLTNPSSAIGLTPTSFTLSEVVVSSGTSGRRLGQQPASTQVITPQMIRRDAPFDISQAINRVPGVYMHAGTMNTNRITIRGIGSRSLYGTDKLKAYYENIPLTDGSGNSSIEDIDQELIGRIEVTKGPNSSLYGAGLAGVINLYGTRPKSLGSSVKTTFTLGSFGTYRSSVSGTHQNERISATAAYSDLRRAGWRDNSAYSRQQAGTHLKVRLKDNAYISFLAVITDLKAFIPSSIGETDFNETPEKAAFSWAEAKGFESYTHSMLGATYYRPIGQWNLKSSLFAKVRDAYEPRPFDILDELTYSIGTRNVIGRKWKQWEFYGGMEVFYDTYSWKTFANLYDNTTNGSVQGDMEVSNLEDRSYANFFAESTYSPNKRLQFTAGINVNSTHYELTDRVNPDSTSQSGDHSFPMVISPKVGATYQAGQHHFFGNISHGFSPPSLTETLTPEGQINPNISPETGWNFELGSRGMLGIVHYDLTTYFMDIQNLIVAERVGPDRYVGINAGVNHHYGLDALINCPIALSDSYQVNLFTSASLMNYRFQRFEHQETNYDGNQLTGVPSWLAAPGVELLSENGWYGNLNAHLVGEIPMDDANTIFSDAYTILNAKVGYQKVLGPVEMDLHVGISNLTDTHYASMLLINATGFGGNEPRYYYPGAPRNYFAGMAVKYRFQ